MAGPGPFNADPDANPQAVIHTVDLGDGRVADIEAPANATPEQLYQTYQASQGQQVAPGLDHATDATQAVEADRMSPEDEATLSGLYQNGTADQINAFLHSKGRAVDPALLAEHMARRAKDPSSINYAVNYAGKPVEDTAGGAFARGADQGLTLGLGDEAHGFLNGVTALLHGQSYGDAYDRTVDNDRALLGEDSNKHGVASLLGNLAGGAVLPFGLAKAGLTPTMEAVALKAGQEAVAAGATADAAKVIAARAVARRIATEGAAYGGAYGAGSAEGGVGERLKGGVEGGLVGAAIPVGAMGVGKALRPVVNAAIGGINAIGDGARGVLSGITADGAQARAAGLLRDAAVDPDAALAAIEARTPSITGASPTLAEVAGDAGLAGFQRGVVNTDLKNAPLIGDRQAQNALARTGTASDTFGTGLPQDVQDYAAGQVGDAQAATAQQQAARQAAVDARLASGRSAATDARQGAEQAQAGAREAIGPVADRDATGAQAREQFAERYSAAKRRSSEAYNAPALVNPQPVNIPPTFWAKLRKTADQFYGDAGGYIPSQLATILDDAAKDGANTRTLTNVDRRLADFAGEAGMAGRRQEAAFAERVRGDLADVAQKNAPQEYRDALANAKAVRAEQGAIFETGDAPKAFATDRYGRPVVGDNTVPSKLVRPGAAGGDTAAGLSAAIGPDASESVVRQELRRVADEGQITTGAQAQALATRYGEAARRFPSVQRDLQTLVSHGNALDAARDAETAALRASATADETAGIRERSALEESLAKTPLARVANSDVSPSAFVSQSLSKGDDGRQLRQLYSQVKANPEAAAGFRRALGDHIVDAGAGPNFTASGQRIPSPAFTREAINAVVSRAGDALTSQQKMVLKAVSRELEQLNFAYTASKPAGSETAINKTFSEVVKRLPVVGKAIPLLKHVISALDNSSDVKKLITQSILDPDFAATLLKRPTPKHWIQVRDGLMGRKVATTLRLAGQPYAQGRLESALSSLPSRAAANQPGNSMAIANGQNAQQQPEYQGTAP